MRIKFVDQGGIELAEVNQSHVPRVGECIILDLEHTIKYVTYKYQKLSMSNSLSIDYVEVIVS